MLRRSGIRARLVTAFLLVAAVTAAITVGLAGRAASSQLPALEFSDTPLDAGFAADLAAELYRAHGALSPEEIRTLNTAGVIDAFAVAVRDRRGRLLPGSPRLDPRELILRPVRVDGRTVATVEVAPRDTAHVQAETAAMRGRLVRRLPLAIGVAGALALVAALVVAVLLAGRMARPLRRLTATATRMERGDLDLRTEPSHGGSEVDQLGQALNSLSQSLEREHRLRRQAASDIAHELRTPAAGILARVEAAQDGVMTDSRRNLEAMHLEALRLNRLIEDVGRLYEAEAPIEIAREPLDLAEVARPLVEAYRDFFEAERVTLRASLERAWVCGDAHRLHQVIDNLLSNALRYTEPEGEVDVRIRTGGEVLIEVEDTGIGIAEDDLPHVFERFWRGEKSRARVTGGSGVGLAVVRELVRSHGGRVEVASAPGRGSRFSVRLAAAAPHAHCR